MEHLIARWQVAGLRGLNPKAAEAQEFVCNLPARIRRLAERKTGERGVGLWRGPVALGAWGRAAAGSGKGRLRWRVSRQCVERQSSCSSSSSCWKMSSTHLTPPPPAARKAGVKKNAVKFSWLYDRALTI